ncbi:MAG TPA: proprotein convertase P-domain-containing protein, partial [Novosphingobium sp.]|nr:proprotein convertase P-domain-containing protein [Novosphingobium sp.]
MSGPVRLFPRILFGLIWTVLSGAVMLASPAAAQSVRSFTNSSSASINAFSPCSSPIVRNFTVSSNFLVGDVDLGVYATHAWRGDIQITLQSPAGTRQQLVNGNAALDGISGDHFNVRLNDSGTQLVNTDGNEVDHSTTAPPPYQHNFIPDAPLAIFNGQTSAGTWRLEICDIFPGADNGTFVRADLYLTPATSSSGTGAIFVVSTTADSGTGSLRQAVIDANATTTEADAIHFAIPGAGPHTITLLSTLPVLSDNGLLIDGATQPGSQCRNQWNGDAHILLINLRGNSTAIDGLRLSGANQTIRGLALSRFTNGVTLQATSNSATLRCNFIGLRPDGTSDSNSTRGVNVYGASARIGGLDAGQGNVISANSSGGILTFAGSSDTSIQGNFIGTDPTGMTARANTTAINHSNGTGTWRDITRNLISGNTTAAIRLDNDDVISPSTDQVRIQRNRIGFNRTLGALLLNAGDGIGFANGSISSVLIGGLAASQGNEISGTVHGISINNATNVIIRGNTIARVGQHGIRLAGVNGATIGGDAATVGNTIGGTGGSGIYGFSGTRSLN